MSSNKSCESRALDLERDLPTTAEDLSVLRALRAASPSWFALTADEFDALLPATALDRRPTVRDDWEPFSLP